MGVWHIFESYRVSGIVEIYKYRHMIAGLVKRELRGRYKGSFAGFLWNYITPVSQILVYTFVFSQILKVGIDNYPVYLIIGMFPWMLFSESISEGAGSFVQYSELVKKNYFPRCVIPISTVTGKLVNFLIAYSLAIVTLILMSFPIQITALAIPFAILLEYLICIGIAMIVSSINVYLRDAQYSINVLLMIWIWLTPIMYDSKMITDECVLAVINANPMTYLIKLFQDLLYYGVWPDCLTWAAISIMSILLLMVGYISVKYTQRRMAELL